MNQQARHEAQPQQMSRVVLEFRIKVSVPDLHELHESFSVKPFPRWEAVVPIHLHGATVMISNFMCTWEGRR